MRSLDLRIYFIDDPGFYGSRDPGLGFGEERHVHLTVVSQLHDCKQISQLCVLFFRNRRRIHKQTAYIAKHRAAET